MKLYRYDRFGTNAVGAAEIYFSTFEVIRETPRCFVIRFYGKEKFILKEARKMFAYPTPEQALTNFIRRTKRAIKFQQIAIDNSISYLIEAEKILNNQSKPFINEEVF